MNTIKATTDLNPEDVRNLVNQWSSKGVFRVRGLGDKIQLSENQSKSAHNITLKTQYEERTVVRSGVPHDGGPVDNFGTPPGPWDIASEHPADFTDREQKIVLPHTDSVESCASCGGKGKLKCLTCQGTGKVNCPKCHGSGRYSEYETRMVPNVGRPGYTQKRELVHKMCTCGGGKILCQSCGGRGIHVCKDCQGHGALKFSSVLNVLFRAVSLNHFINPSAMPDQVVQSIPGEILHEDRAVRIGNFTGITDEVDKCTRDLIHKSQTISEQTQRILFQQLRIQRVPIHAVSYQYANSGTKRLWIYGSEGHVYAPDAPVTWKKLLKFIGIGAACVFIIILLISFHWGTRK